MSLLFQMFPLRVQIQSSHPLKYPMIIKGLQILDSQAMRLVAFTIVNQISDSSDLWKARVYSHPQLLGCFVPHKAHRKQVQAITKNRKLTALGTLHPQPFICVSFVSKKSTDKP